MIPVGDDRGPCGWSPFTWLLAVALLGVAVWFWYQPATARQATELLALRPRELAAVLDGPVRRLLADGVLPLLGYAVVPCGPVQVGLALIFLLAFGRRVEHDGGPAALLWLFALGAVAAGIAHAAWDPTSRVPAAGAPGAVSAVLGAYAVRHRRARARLLVPVVVVPLFLRLPVWAVLLAWVALQAPPIQRLFVLTATGPIAWPAVGAGFAVGVVASPLLRGQPR
ncbi:MAG: rhomboid family intramembrane serine protease [Planctomycetota bacterium]